MSRRTTLSYFVHLTAAGLQRQKPPKPPADLDEKVLLGLIMTHHVEQLVAAAIRQTSVGLPGCSFMETLGRVCRKDLGRTIRQEHETERLLVELAQQSVRHMPLKGLILRDWYPDPVYRYMTDIDILIHTEDLERAVQITRQLGYDLYYDGQKHISMYKPSGLTVELHKAPEQAVLETDTVFTWRDATLQPGCCYRYQMKPEAFYVSFIRHMAHHFIQGGVGIRSVADIHVLREHIGWEIDWNIVNRELTKLDLQVFAEEMVRLAKDWFGPDFRIDLDDTLGQYILSSALLGTERNAAILRIRRHQTAGSQIRAKRRAILQLVFPEKKNMESRFSWLKNRSWLMPVGWLMYAYQIVRLRPGRLRLFGVISQASQDRVEEITQLMDRLKLR